MNRIFTALFFLTFATFANAGCWLDGIEYPTGTVKGPMICAPDGYWRPIKK